MVEIIGKYLRFLFILINCLNFREKNVCKVWLKFRETIKNTEDGRSFQSC
jgi:hypothetical protein